MMCPKLSLPMYPCASPLLSLRILSAALAIIIKHKEIATFSYSILLQFINLNIGGIKNHILINKEIPKVTYYYVLILNLNLKRK